MVSFNSIKDNFPGVRIHKNFTQMSNTDNDLVLSINFLFFPPRTPPKTI